MCKTWVRSLGQADPLEKEMATHPSILAWEISWTEEPGGLQLHGIAKSRTRLSDFHFLLRRSWKKKKRSWTPSNSSCGFLTVFLARSSAGPYSEYEHPLRLGCNRGISKLELCNRTDPTFNPFSVTCYVEDLGWDNLIALNLSVLCCGIEVIIHALYCRLKMNALQLKTTGKTSVVTQVGFITCCTEENTHLRQMWDCSVRGH